MLSNGCFGNIGRLQTARMRRNTEHILNVYTSRQTAMVEADLDFPDGLVTLRRTGSHRSSVLEWIRDGEVLSGAAAELALVESLASGDLDLESAMLASGLIQQDAMRQVLQTKPRDRYDQISSFLGLGVLQRFESATDDYLARCIAITSDARRALQSSELELSSAQQRINTIHALNALSPPCKTQRGVWRRRTRTHVRRLDLAKTPTSDWVRRAAAEVNELASASGELVSRSRRWESATAALAAEALGEPDLLEQRIRELEVLYVRAEAG